MYGIGFRLPLAEVIYDSKSIRGRDVFVEKGLAVERFSLVAFDVL